MDDADHLAYDTLLSKYVDRDGYVDYAAWKKSTADRQVLRGYLEHLSRDAQLKFWINAYNAVTLEGILQVYPTSSIRNHTAKLFGYNIWKELPLRVGHETYSLDQMEHEILRKMGERRFILRSCVLRWGVRNCGTKPIRRAKFGSN